MYISFTDHRVSKNSDRVLKITHRSFIQGDPTREVKRHEYRVLASGDEMVRASDAVDVHMVQAPMAAVGAFASLALSVYFFAAYAGVWSSVVAVGLVLLGLFLVVMARLLRRKSDVLLEGLGVPVPDEVSADGTLSGLQAAGLPDFGLDVYDFSALRDARAEDGDRVAQELLVRLLRDNLARHKDAVRRDVRLVQAQARRRFEELRGRNPGGSF